MYLQSWNMQGHFERRTTEDESCLLAVTPTSCWVESYFETPVVALLVKKSPNVIESENLFPRAQVPATGPISEPDEPRQQLYMPC